MPNSKLTFLKKILIPKAVPVLGLAWLFTACQPAFAQAPSSNASNCSDTAQSCSSSSDEIPTSAMQTVSPSMPSPPNSSLSRPQVYIDPAGMNTVDANDRDRERTPRMPGVSQQPAEPEPLTDFQRLARSSTNQLLPIFGKDLFGRFPSSFAPPSQIPASSDYVIGPGDQVLLRVWGGESFNSQLTVDTGGSIYVPKVGAIHVAGLRYEDLDSHIRMELSRIYRNFSMAVNMGNLRSIQVYIVGETKQPGAYTVSAFSTLVNALFVSGGPSSQGSMRKITLQRKGQPELQFDLYDLLLRGDKSKDVRLQQGDVIFIPPVGPLVALAGSVHHPAIYELNGETSINALLRVGGGFTSTASTVTVSLERIDSDELRHASTINLSALGNTTMTRDGDIVMVKHISPGYQTSVTIRGNLANPGRFAWFSGMRLSDIIPERKSLLTNGYWTTRNRLGLPSPLFEPLTLAPPTNRSNPNAYLAAQRADENAELQSEQSKRAAAATLAQRSQQVASSSVDSTGGSERSLLDQVQGTAPVPGVHRIELPSDEIDWSYAVVERLNPVTLKSELLPFNLGKLVLDHDASQNLELIPNDVVTILSQADIPVPLDEQTKYVRLEGEFIGAGVYSVKPGETLRELVARAGGLSPKAYLFGSSFLRESSRRFQQQRLDEYINRLAAEQERAVAVRSVSTTNGVMDPSALASQRNMISQLRAMRATGRIVLDFEPNSASLNTVPDIPLENGDVFHVPPRSNTVSVIGAVYGQNVFLYKPEQHLGDYVNLAGHPNRVADAKHAFVIRANGSIYSREYARGMFSNRFDQTDINAGDAIVVPEKMIKPDALHVVLEYSQIFASFGILAAALN